jgi:hypothetical protein
LKNTWGSKDSTVSNLRIRKVAYLEFHKRIQNILAWTRSKLNLSYVHQTGQSSRSFSELEGERLAEPVIDILAEYCRLADIDWRFQMEHVALLLD